VLADVFCLVFQVVPNHKLPNPKLKLPCLGEMRLQQLRSIIQALTKCLLSYHGCYLVKIVGLTYLIATRIFSSSYV